MEMVIVTAKSQLAAKHKARDTAENLKRRKRHGWRVKPIDKADGSCYRVMQFTVAK
jgi:hypothetical protein